ncbi:hypothetical protein GCK32_015975 [Trichostrongylus colubriformis]|uniref:Uncharacterized protein n=1 Tax=Trichostrongylus colubriformis TaxID=6319 RepID=A0AAN8IDP2_TRICO
MSNRFEHLETFPVPPSTLSHLESGTKDEKDPELIIKDEKKISKSTIDVLHGSRRDHTVRQCSCDELSDCYDSAKQQAYDCFDPCFAEIKPFSLTDDPENLRACFQQRRGFVDNIVTCFRTKIKACEDNVEKARGTIVKSYDYPDMIKRVEDIINEQIQTFLNSITSNRVKQVVNAGASVARCIKMCFIEKNKDGFCFDKKGCEPNIADRNAKLAIKQCSRLINWKKEVSDLCKCSSEAGVQ